MAWIYLVIAGVLEAVWSFSMKKSDGFTKLSASIITFVTMLASFALLALAMSVLPLGTAYSVWTGIGAIGAFLAGVFILGEQASCTRVISMVFIVLGIIGLKLTSN